MSNEHNPIAQRVTQLQQKWAEVVKKQPDSKIIRWKIKQKEVRIFEGFCKIESSSHGKLPEFFVVMLTPFSGYHQYAQDLIEHWIGIFENDKFVKEAGFKWDYKPFKKALENKPKGTNANEILIELLASFKKSIDNELVLGLIPYSVESAKGFQTWLVEMVELGLPENIKMMILDNLEKPNLDHLEVALGKQIATAEIDLNSDAAVEQLIKSGNPNAPDVQLRICVLEMSKALSDNSQKRLHHWGQKALEVTQKSGITTLFATAHIVYAGMLFNFKKYEKIETLLDSAMRITKQGLKNNPKEATFRPLWIQLHAFKASLFQLQNNNTKAMDFFQKQADICLEQNMKLQSLTVNRQVLELAKKHDGERYDERIPIVFALAETLSEEEKINSDFNFLAKDYLEYLQKQGNSKEAKELDIQITALLGEEWKEKIEETKKIVNNSALNLVGI